MLRVQNCWRYRILTVLNTMSQVALSHIERHRVIWRWHNNPSFGIFYFSIVLQKWKFYTLLWCKIFKYITVNRVAISYYPKAMSKINIIFIVVVFFYFAKRNYKNYTQRTMIVLQVGLFLEHSGYFRILISRNRLWQHH